MSNPWIQTYTGVHFDLLPPKVENVCIEDIAYALSHLARYTGHANRFYSVAQHSVFVSLEVDPWGIEPFLGLQGLLHDAHEAYMGDISSPLKRILPGVREYEEQIASVVREKFGLPSVLNEKVGQEDLNALLLEKGFLFDDHLDWELGSVHSPHKKTTAILDARWGASAASAAFLYHYHWLLRKLGREGLD